MSKAINTPLPRTIVIRFQHQQLMADGYDYDLWEFREAANLTATEARSTLRVGGKALREFYPACSLDYRLRLYEEPSPELAEDLNLAWHATRPLFKQCDPAHVKGFIASICARLFHDRLVFMEFNFKDDILSVTNDWSYVTKVPAGPPQAHVLRL